jgi:hypothetical protein
MKTVPLADGTGTIPLRASKNPVLGVFLHHCGEIASVHQPKGKRSHTRYLMCDRCGQDQAAGAAYQEEIKANIYPSLEVIQAAIDAVSSDDKSTVVITEPAVIEQIIKPITDNLTDKALEVTPPQTNDDGVCTDESDTLIDTLLVPVTATDKPTDVIPPPNPKRIGLAAAFGAIFGGVLALVL